MRSPALIRRALAGALVFLVAEFALFQAAGSGVGPGGGRGWFLDSGGGVLVMAVALAACAAVVGLVGSAPPVQSGSAVALGAVVAMVVMLAALGPGNLFPIVIVVGSAVIGASAALGTATAGVLRRVFGRSV